MKVFISYSTKDLTLADRLRSILADRMITIWIDFIQMRPGDSLMKKITAGIRSSDILLVLITENSVKSPWVKKEVRMAITLERDGNGPRVIPLIVRPVKVPRNLRPKLYLEVSQKNMKIVALLGAIYRDSYIFRINLGRKDFKVDSESIRRSLLEYYRNPHKKVHVYIEHNDFNGKLLSLMEFSLKDDTMPDLGVDQVKDAIQPLPVTLPIFWRSIEVIFEQLISDLYVRDGGTLGTLLSLQGTFVTILNYCFAALVDELRYGVFTYYAKAAHRLDIASFVNRYKRKDWHTFILEMAGETDMHALGAVDLIGKAGITTTRAWTPLSLMDEYDLQGRGMSVSASPVGPGWYSKYLPQVVGREVRLIALRGGKLLQTKGNKIGIHPEEYEKAGLG